MRTMTMVTTLTREECNTLQSRYRDLLTPLQWAILPFNSELIRYLYRQLMILRMRKHISNMNLSDSDHQRLLIKG
jgi:hypothetical protein